MRVRIQFFGLNVADIFTNMPGLLVASLQLRRPGAVNMQVARDQIWYAKHK